MKSNTVVPQKVCVGVGGRTPEAQRAESFPYPLSCKELASLS